MAFKQLEISAPGRRIPHRHEHQVQTSLNDLDKAEEVSKLRSP
jgi:hypothetical protein